MNTPLRAVCATAALMLASAPAWAQSLTITLAHEEPADTAASAAHLSATVFKEMVESMSNGDMAVDIQAASALGNQRERMDLTQAGIIQVNIASVGGLAQFYPAINGIELPFVFPNEIVAERVFDGPFGDQLATQISEATGLHLLGVTAGDFYVFTNSDHMVKSPADMAGLKVRTMSVPSHMELMNSLGAAATPVPWDELYGALETGVVDAQHNPIPIVAIGNLQEVQSYATMTNHLYGADWWVTSEDFIAGLTPEQRRIFITAAETAKVAGRGAKIALRANTYGADFLKEAGLEVYYPNAEEMKAFRDIAVPAVMGTMETEFGAEAVTLGQSLIEAVASAEAEIYGE